LSNSVIHDVSHGQRVGRCSVKRRAEEATRAGTETIVRRTVAVVALPSWGSPVKGAAARVRLNAITAQTNHAAFAENEFALCAHGHQQRVEPLHPGVPVAGALFAVSVDFDDRIVDVDHDPTGVDAGGQGCAIGESTQEPRRDSIEARGCVPRPRNCAMTQRTLPHRWRWPQRWLPFVRGDLYRLRAPRDARGHEQSGARYAVVVQSDDLPLSTWVIAPLSTGRREASFRPEIEVNDTKTRVMVEQLTVIDPQTRLGEFAGRLSSSGMQAVDHALQVVLALE